MTNVNEQRQTKTVEQPRLLELRPDDVTLDAKSHAAKFGFKEATQADWRSRGDNAGPPFIKLEQTVLYCERWTREWLMERAATSTAQFAKRNHRPAQARRAVK